MNVGRSIPMWRIKSKSNICMLKLLSELLNLKYILNQVGIPLSI